MLDEKSKEVLYFLEGACKNTYKVIEIQDIFKNVSNINKDSLKKILGHLDDVGYISIKYKDKNVYCVTVLPFGKQFIEQENANIKKIHEIKKNIGYLYVIFFLLAILGAFLGTLLCNIIF